MNWFDKIATTKERPFPPSKEASKKRKAKELIERLETMFLTKPMIPCVLYSFGKDSSATMSLTLVAWVRAMKSNPNLAKIPFLISYSNTGYESPHKYDYMKKEVKDIKYYSKKNGVNLYVLEGKPRTNESWAGKVIAGSIVNWNVKLGKSAGCSVSWKIKPNERLVKPFEKLAKEIGIPLVKILGSRTEESITRAKNLESYGADPLSICPYNGNNYLYPVMDWSVEDIWSYLLFCESEMDSNVPGIKDGFNNTVIYYNSMNSSECSALDVHNGKSCKGSRDGCYICLMSDKPELDQNIGINFPHIAPLQEYRKFMLYNDNNSLNRSYVQQSPSSMNDLKASCNSGSYLLDLLRIGLTIQKRENERAQKEKSLVASGLHLDPQNALTEPTFTIFEPIDIAWIDWNWDSRGLMLEPNSALKCYYEIFYQNIKYDIPLGYKRKENELLDFNKYNGKIFYPELNVKVESSKDLNLNDICTDSTWKFATNEECALVLTKDVLEKWLQETCFIKAADRWVESGILTPPKSQLSRIKKRREWVKNIYRLGLNKKAFEGGPLTIKSDELSEPTEAPLLGKVS